MDNFWKCEVCNFDSPEHMEVCAFCGTSRKGEAKFNFELTFKYSDPIVETGSDKEQARSRAQAQAEAKRRALAERFRNVEVTVN